MVKQSKVEGSSRIPDRRVIFVTRKRSCEIRKQRPVKCLHLENEYLIKLCFYLLCGIYDIPQQEMYWLLKQNVLFSTLCNGWQM